MYIKHFLDFLLSPIFKTLFTSILITSTGIVHADVSAPKFLYLQPKPTPGLSPEALSEYQTFVDLVVNKKLQEALAMLNSRDFSYFPQWMNYLDPEKGTPLMMVLHEGFEKVISKTPYFDMSKIYNEERSARFPYEALANKLLDKGVEVKSTLTFYQKKRDAPVKTPLPLSFYHEIITNALSESWDFGNVEILERILRQIKPEQRKAEYEKLGYVRRSFDILDQDIKKFLKFAIEEGIVLDEEYLYGFYIRGESFYENLILLMAAKKIERSPEGFQKEEHDIYLRCRNGPFLSNSLTHLKESLKLQKLALFQLISFIHDSHNKLPWEILSQIMTFLYPPNQEYPLREAMQSAKNAICHVRAERKKEMEKKERRKKGIWRFLTISKNDSKSPPNKVLSFVESCETFQLDNRLSEFLSRQFNLLLYLKSLGPYTFFGDSSRFDYLCGTLYTLGKKMPIEIRKKIKKSLNKYFYRYLFFPLPRKNVLEDEINAEIKRIEQIRGITHQPVETNACVRKYGVFSNLKGDSPSESKGIDLIDYLWFPRY